MNKSLIRFAMLVLTATVLASCANDPVARDSAVRIDYGTVDAIEIYRGSDNKPINVDTVLGGVAGGVIGHQIAEGANVLLNGFGDQALMQPSLEFATPEEIGAAALFLCSQAARQIRGIALPVDGGWTAQ